MMPYQFVYSTKFGSYAFNGIDMNPNPGPRRPFNFFGHVEQVCENWHTFYHWQKYYKPGTCKLNLEPDYKSRRMIVFFLLNFKKKPGS